MSAVSKQTAEIIRVLGPFGEFGTDDELWEAMRRPEACDSCSGTRTTWRRAPTWRRSSAPRSQRVRITTRTRWTSPKPWRRSARSSVGLPVAFRDEDVLLTNGNFAGLGIALQTLVDAGDEVMFVSPPWFFYEALIVAAGATPVRVLADREHDFDLDLASIEAAITTRTRAIIVNSPHNPSGRIYAPEPLDALGDDLRCRNRAVRTTDLPAVRRGVQPDRVHAPGVRHAGRALPAFVPLLHVREDVAVAGVTARIHRGRSAMRRAVTSSGTPSIGPDPLGWAYPVCDPAVRGPGSEQSPDMPTLQRRRDKLVSRSARGLQLVVPEGTSTCSCARSSRTPRFAEALRTHDVSCCPARCSRCPGGSGCR